MKSRLIELLRDAKKNTKGANCDLEREHLFADYLLENGVIVPPCKVGDKVYVIMETSCEDIDGVYTTCEFYNLKSENLCTLPKGKCPYRYRIAECYVTEMNLLSFTAKWGKTVFLTKEEAEQALKGGADNV